MTTQLPQLEKAVTVTAAPAQRRSSTGRLRRPKPQTFVFVVVAVVLAWQIVIPLVILVWGAFTNARPGQPNYFSTSTATLDNVNRAFEGGRLGTLVLNTAEFALGSTLLAFVLGTFLAIVVERTNTPMRRLLTFMIAVRMILPGILSTISWIFLASPTIGALNGWFQDIFGTSKAPLNIFSMPGMIWTEGLDMVPLVFLLMSASLRSMDPTLEEASFAAGKGVVATLRRVTMPLILPALLASLMMCIIRGTETFEVPILLGVEARKPTLVYEIWLKATAVPTDFGVAAVCAVLILVFCASLMWLYHRATRSADSYSVVTGKAFRPRRIDLGKARWLTFAGAWLVVACTLLLPLVILVWASLYPPNQGFQPITPHDFHLLSLNNFKGLWDDDTAKRAFVNSVLLGISSAAVIVVLVTVVAWLSVKAKVRGGKFLDFLAFAPVAIPAVAMGVAFLWLYLEVPVHVYGTLWILFLLYVARFTAMPTRMMSAAMTQIKSELMEAAEVAGAGIVRTMVTVTMPLLRPAMLAAFVFVMIHAFRDLTASLMVYSYGNEVIGVTLLNIWNNGSFGETAAFGIVLIIILGAFTAVSNLIAGRFGVKETS